MLAEGPCKIIVCSNYPSQVIANAYTTHDPEEE